MAAGCGGKRMNRVKRRAGRHIGAMNASDAQDSPAHFEALIVPHRSLGPAGLRWLAAALCLLSGVHLARPVAGRRLAGDRLHRAGGGAGDPGCCDWNARRDRGSEMLLLTDAGLQIVRTDRHGAAARADARRRLAAGDAAGAAGGGRRPCWCMTAGMHVEIGADLGEEEKQRAGGGAAGRAGAAAQPGVRQPAAALAGRVTPPPGPST